MTATAIPAEPPTAAAPASRELRQFSVVELLAYDGIVVAMELVAYGLALWAAFAVVHLIGAQRPELVAAAVLAAAAVALLAFVLVLLALRRTLFRGIRAGRFLRTSARLWPWSFSVALHMIFHRSPFANLVNGNLLLRQLYYRGMGLRLPWSTYLGQNVKVVDPWLTTIGADSLLGEGAVVSCHKIDRDVVTLEPVTIGRHVLIGAFAHVQPGVVIEDHAVIAANALVVRGSRVRAGETWIGNPAKPASLFARPAAPPGSDG